MINCPLLCIVLFCPDRLNWPSGSDVEDFIVANASTIPYISLSLSSPLKKGLSFICAIFIDLFGFYEEQGNLRGIAR